ncbi:MAG: DUF4831 family protein [Paludibacteraceae bacterium]|nr:DUF4831 family protein [Paludibacteraceae bacterium]
MKRMFILMAMAACSSLLFSQKVEVMPYDGVSPRNGKIHYVLPKTEVVVVAKAELTIRKPGPFSQYAERFLAIDDAIKSELHKWKLVSLDAEMRAVADSSKQYLISVDKNGFTGKLTFTSIEQDRIAVDDVDTSIVFRMDYLEEEALVSTSVPKMAERAAKQIYQIREMKTSLITGDNSHQIDSKALKMMIKQLDQKEKELVALFVGKEKTYTMTREYAYVPANDVVRMIIGRISTVDGLVNADNLLGNPIYLSVIGDYLYAKRDRNSDKTRNRGFYYNVPGMATIVVSDNKNIKAEKKVKMPQFGFTEWLNSIINNVTIDSNTGEIVSFSIEKNK